MNTWCSWLAQFTIITRPCIVTAIPISMNYILNCVCTPAYTLVMCGTNTHALHPYASNTTFRVIFPHVDQVAFKLYRSYNCACDHILNVFSYILIFRCHCIYTCSHITRSRIMTCTLYSDFLNCVILLL